MKEIKIIIDEITTKCVCDTFVELVSGIIAGDTISDVEYRHMHFGDVRITHIMTKVDHITVGSFYNNIDGNIHVVIHNCRSMNEVHICVGYDSFGDILIENLTRFGNNHNDKYCEDSLIIDRLYDIIFGHDRVDEEIASLV